MDPVTAITLATTVLKTTGLGEKIGEWLGGDKGEKAAGKILDIAQKTTGAASPQGALEEVMKNGAVSVGLKQELLRHEVDILKLYNQDLESARAMQVAALQSGDVVAQRFLYMYAGFWSLAGVGYIFAITFFPIPEDSVRFADTALGFMLGTIIAQIINFFFGSSKGSSDKTKILRDQTMRLFYK